MPILQECSILLRPGAGGPFRWGSGLAIVGVTRLVGGAGEAPPDGIDVPRETAGAILSGVAGVDRGGAAGGADREGGRGGARIGDSGGEMERRGASVAASDNSRTLEGGAGGPSKVFRVGGGGGTVLEGVEETRLDGRGGGGGGAGRPGNAGAGRPDGSPDGTPGTGREMGDPLAGDSILGESLLGGSGGRAGVAGGVELRTGGGARRGGVGTLAGGAGTDLGGGGGTARASILEGALSEVLERSTGDSDSVGLLLGGGTGRDGAAGGRGGAGGGTALAGVGGTVLAGVAGGVGVGTARAGAGGGTALPGVGGGIALAGA